MKNKVSKFAQAVTFGLSLALAFSCSSSDDDGGGGGGDVSSSSVKSSSSVNSQADCTGFVEGTKREHYGKSKAQFCDARDGKKYVYVEIGSLTWMAENLNYNASGSRCYNNQESNCNAYGRLYNWGTAKTICPTDWRLPSDNDWDDLMRFFNPTYLDNKDGYCPNVGTNLKAASGWYVGVFPKGTDDNGFTALPGGFGDLDGDYGVGESGYWWSESDIDANNANAGSIYSEYEDVFWGENDKYNVLLSVRCVRGNLPSVCGSSLACTAKDNDDNYYCSSNCTMKKYGFMTDMGGQVYKTIKIGTQTWMAENLNYNAPNSKCFNDDDDNCKVYGRLYDWETANTICPTGWHLPSDEDWNVLTAFVGDNTGTKLKSISGWNDDGGNSGNGTDNYGFTALQSDLGYSNGITFGSAFWWSATPECVFECPPCPECVVPPKCQRPTCASRAIGRMMQSNDEYVIVSTASKSNSYYSVRCLQN